MLHKLRTSVDLFPRKEVEERAQERVKLFCKYLFDCGVQQGQIKRVFPTKPKDALPIEWRKDAALMKRPEYQLAHRLHADRSKRVKVVRYNNRAHDTEVEMIMVRCYNPRCERPWDCWGPEGSMCKTRRVFTNQVVMWGYLTQVCKYLRKDCWRTDLMEEWMMVHDFLTHCANERWSCLANIEEDKQRKVREAQASKEHHQQLTLANKGVARLD
jgi:hypothetical protein